MITIGVLAAIASQAIKSKGNDGKDGAPGKDGADGIPGKNGERGEAGVDGKPGKDGEPGKISPEEISKVQSNVREALEASLGKSNGISPEEIDSIRENVGKAAEASVIKRVEKCEERLAEIQGTKAEEVTKEMLDEREEQIRGYVARILNDNWGPIRHELDEIQSAHALAFFDTNSHCNDLEGRCNESEHTAYVLGIEAREANKRALDSTVQLTVLEERGVKAFSQLCAEHLQLSNKLQDVKNNLSALFQMIYEAATTAPSKETSQGTSSNEPAPTLLTHPAENTGGTPQSKVNDKP